MTKRMLMLAIAGTMIIGMVSCDKEEIPAPAITQTQDVSLRVGESYTFTLPANLRNDAYEITTAAQHASISQLYVSTAGDRVYRYTPEVGFSGTDQVIVSNDQEREHVCTGMQGPPPPPAGMHNGDCKDKDKGEQEDHYIITFNFTMKGSDAAVVSK